ncbi:thioredoxin reductase-like protein [Natrialba chahannaoensis JCM 10990]|uniref:Thioredoxin reductase-like protein n=1 Tax=Natrialba chahannaoensis JCM 10990 TaxID=1227492 RepID=M0B4Z3_9EURY|nr:NAD(P)/FAD-dependent oxidoreductase [Natrialba chahannaoensis]ELZ04719.1 thioredoxin reductase-like protein [Natrialba chahannaoensis JCM 10990]
MTVPNSVDVTVVGAGAAGIGIGVALSLLDLETVLLEREEVGASFRRWPDEMQFITPSFPSNSFGLTDLNAITPTTSPAVTLDREHPRGEEYADYLEAVADFHELSVKTGVEVVGLQSDDGTRASASTGQDTAVPAVDGGTIPESESGDELDIKSANKIDSNNEVSIDEESDGVFEQPNGNGFVLETSQGTVHSEYVVWAAGQFGSPRTDVFPGAESCVHTSEVRSWVNHASANSADSFLIIGGYESGIDAAVALVEAGCRVRILDRGEPWARRGPDPSEVLSPYTLERLESVADTDRLFVEGGAVVEAVCRDEDGCFEIRARAADGYELDEGESSAYTVPTRPILATGFGSNLGPVADHFPRKEEVVQLTERDESPTTPGLFLAGPDITHNGVKFCFIYKFRSRFPIVAETIGSRLGVDTGPLDVYREQNMYLEDLSCCEPDMCDCD